MFYRAIVTISLLALLVTTFGCQSQPTKMYSGPKSDRSELALISGKSHRWSDVTKTKVFLVDGNAVGEEKGDGSRLPGEQEVLVSPGKHTICIAHQCHRHYGVSRFDLWLKATFELTVEAGRRYHVKMQQKPFEELSREEKDRLPFRVPHQLWVEDMDTGGTVSIQRHKVKDSVSVPLTESRDGRARYIGRYKTDNVTRYYDANDTKLPLDEVSILFAQNPTQISRIDDKTRPGWTGGWPLRTTFFADNPTDMTDNIADYECHLLPGRHEITAKMYRWNMSFEPGVSHVTTKAGPLTKAAVFKKGHVYYLKDCQVEPNKWTFRIVEVGTIHQAAPSLITPNIPYHWDDCWNNTPNNNSDIVFNRVNLLKGDEKNALQDSNKAIELDDGDKSKVKNLSGTSKEYAEDDLDKSIYLNKKDTKQVKVTYRSNPPGGTLYELNGKLLGQCPKVLWHDLDEEAIANGYLDVRGMMVRWPSGPEKRSGKLIRITIDGTDRQATFFQPGTEDVN